MNCLTLDKCLHGTELSYETGYKLSLYSTWEMNHPRVCITLLGSINDLYCSRREHSMLKIGGGVEKPVFH